jgi:phage tail protein X
MSEVLTVPVDGMTLSKLLWLRFRKPMPGLRERVQALNPGLAAAGPGLPRGTQVRLPDDFVSTARSDVVQLWE